MAEPGSGYLSTVYKNAQEETTQWDDIQRKLGNLPAKAPRWKPEQYKPEVEAVKDRAWVERHDVEELQEELEDEFVDDRFLEGYRQRRIRELQQASTRPRFGAVEEIRAAEFVQKVTDASRGAPAAAPQAREAGADEGQGQAECSSSAQEGVWVVVELYKEGHVHSARMSSCVAELAGRYPSTKFVRIISTDCIPKYPDANLPTLLVYHGGACLKHLAGISAFGGARITPEQVALVLNGVGPVCSSGEGDEEAGEGGELGREDAKLVKQLVQRVVAQREEGDEDSDFD